ncbi:DUF1003 domain-containing protein [Phenylobacterium sp.]|uniref:DUF1003 domain-containing protein n=1 Tax=Phenylobacterium sp. TaxID=1871053 RepID=UPI002F3F18B0
MPDDVASDAPEPLPDAVAASVEHVVALHREHHAQATALQRGIDAATARLARPGALVLVALVLAFGTGLAVWARGGAVDQPLFAWLEFAATVAALIFALLILVTQRRADELAERRARLTLELAILADRKSAKIIELLEDLRRDHPDVVDRDDPEAHAMAEPVDPAAVGTAIDAQVDA